MLLVILQGEDISYHTFCTDLSRLKHSITCGEQQIGPKEPTMMWLSATTKAQAKLVFGYQLDLVDGNL